MYTTIANTFGTRVLSLLGSKGRIFGMRTVRGVGTVFVDLALKPLSDVIGNREKHDWALDIDMGF